MIYISITMENHDHEPSWQQQKIRLQGSACRIRLQQTIDDDDDDDSDDDNDDNGDDNDDDDDNNDDDDDNDKKILQPREICIQNSASVNSLLGTPLQYRQRI